MQIFQQQIINCMLHNILDILNFKNILKLISHACNVAAKIVITYVVHILLVLLWRIKQRRRTSSVLLLGLLLFLLDYAAIQAIFLSPPLSLPEWVGLGSGLRGSPWAERIFLGILTAFCTNLIEGGAGREALVPFYLPRGQVLNSHEARTVHVTYPTQPAMWWGRWVLGSNPIAFTPYHA